MTLLAGLHLREKYLFSGFKNRGTAENTGIGDQRSASATDLATIAHANITYPCQTSITMSEQHTSAAPATPPDTDPRLADAHRKLCSVRDELLLFAGIAARPSVQPQVPICRSTLAYCLDHLAQRVEAAVKLLEQATQATPTPPHDQTTPHA
ncbi:hypothetical protein [Dyella acidiphila]|uniref:XAC0095-like domain-containing protein n=1 Tax=Dyella acidiphila TaxID=2775866 RepID=A0ABR9GFC9_9GAMM|nr:hypothetical protein [Dyella acidiphila]MBE1162762.1 hypothetical protein [Dyella acidiphila]